MLAVDETNRAMERTRRRLAEQGLDPEDIARAQIHAVSMSRIAVGGARHRALRASDEGLRALIRSRRCGWSSGQILPRRD